MGSRDSAPNRKAHNMLGVNSLKTYKSLLPVNQNAAWYEHIERIPGVIRFDHETYGYLACQAGSMWMTHTLPALRIMRLLEETVYGDTPEEKHFCYLRGILMMKENHHLLAIVLLSKSCFRTAR